MFHVLALLLSIFFKLYFSAIFALVLRAVVPYSLSQALFLCNICVDFRQILPIGKLLLIHASTNATDDHKYSPLPSADFDSSEVLVSFSAFIFS